MYKHIGSKRSKLKNFAPKILLCAQLIVLSVRNANIVFGGTAEELGVWNFEFGIVRQGALRSVILQMSLQFIGEFAAVGRALTKTFLHSPFMLFEPSAIPLWYIWSYENKFSRPYIP